MSDKDRESLTAHNRSSSEPIKLDALAHGRSGDKGNRLNIGIVAIDQQAYDRLEAQLTAAFVADRFDGLVIGNVTRYELPNLFAFNFLCEGALDGGGPLSLRYDTQGKTYAAALLECRLPERDV